MARTPTIQIPLGFKAPNFDLPDLVSFKNVSLKDVRGDKVTVIFFTCNHCPYVLHLIDKLVEIAHNYEDKGVNFVAINSNDVANYPDDSPEKMTIFAQKYKFNFPYLFDETQEVAKAYEAACTPDFNVFDAELNCVYRGQFDGSRPSNAVEVTGEDLIRTLEDILQGKEISDQQTPSVGCNIKWKN